MMVQKLMVCHNFFFFALIFFVLISIFSSIHSLESGRYSLHSSQWLTSL